MNTPTWISALRSGRSLLYKLLEISVFRNKDHDVNPALHEILMYGAVDEEQMKQIGLNNLHCINYVILHANRTVDVCVPSLASDSLAKCLIDIHQQRKVKIRIVIHNSDNFDNLQLFAQNGIEVKIIRPSVRLEHEFVVIDACGAAGLSDALVVLGSLDYDFSSPNCNRDTTLLTSELTVVTTLYREFERVWNSVTDVILPTDDKTN